MINIVHNICTYSSSNINNNNNGDENNNTYNNKNTIAIYPWNVLYQSKDDKRISPSSSSSVALDFLKFIVVKRREMSQYT